MGRRTASSLWIAARVLLLLTVITGIAYPLAVLGIAQGLFPNAANGSLIRVDGRVVGSELAAQPFADPAYVVPRPSATGHAPDATGFANLGPNTRELRQKVRARLAEAIARERPYVPGLTASDVPVDMVTTTGSGIDPHVSRANAELQAARVAAVRGLPLGRVLELIEESTDGRSLGILGEPGVNVLRLNLALDREGGAP